MEEREMYIQKAFKESGEYNLFPEFVETLINETEIPMKLRRKIWALASTTDDQDAPRCASIVAAFQDSEGPIDLIGRWQAVVATWWPTYIDCPLKKELEAL